MAVLSWLCVAVVLSAASARMMKLERGLEDSASFVRELLGRDSFCSSPAAKEKVSFSDKFVGRAKVDFDMYSGYVNVTTGLWSLCATFFVLMW